MLARSTVQGMQEPPFVGRVKSIVPTSFLCRNQNNPKTLEAELGDGDGKGLIKMKKVLLSVFLLCECSFLFAQTINIKDVVCPR